MTCQNRAEMGVPSPKLAGIASLRGRLVFHAGRYLITSTREARSQIG